MRDGFFVGEISEDFADFFKDFPKGEKVFYPIDRKNAGLYPKYTGIFVPYVDKTYSSNLFILDDEFIKGFAVFLYKLMKDMQDEKDVENKLKELSSILRYVQEVISNPKYRDTKTEVVKKVKNLANEFNLEKRGGYRTKKQHVKGNRHAVYLLEKVTGKSAGDSFVVIAEKKKNSEEELKTEASRRKKFLEAVSLFLDEKTRKALLRWFEIYRLLHSYPSRYLHLHVFPFDFHFLAYSEEEEKSYYTIKPKNFVKRMPPEVIIEEAGKRYDEKSKKLPEEVANEVKKILNAVKVYYSKRTFVEKLKKIENRIVPLEDWTLFISRFKKSQKFLEMKVKDIEGKKGQTVILSFVGKVYPSKTLKKLAGEDSKVINLQRIFTRGFSGNSTELSGKTVYLALGLGLALYLWAVRENVEFLFVLPDEEREDAPKNELEEKARVFYKFLKRLLSLLPPFPHQGLRKRNLRKLYKPFVLQNLTNSMMKKTKRVSVEITNPVSPIGEGRYILLVEKATDNLLSIEEITNEDSPLYGLEPNSIKGFHLEAYEVETKESQVTLRHVGVAVKLPYYQVASWDALNVDSKTGVILITENTYKRDDYAHISSVLKTKTDFKNRFLVIKNRKLNLIHLKKPNVSDGFIIFKEEMGEISLPVKKLLGIKGDENGMFFALFYPLTYAQGERFDKYGFVTSIGDVFFAPITNSFWEQRAGVVIPILLTLGIFNNDSRYLRIAKGKENRLLRETFKIKRGNSLYNFGKEYATVEGAARALSLLKGEGYEK